MVVRVCPGIETKSLKCEKCTSAKLPIDHQNTRCVKLFYQKEKLSPGASTICCPCVVLATYPNIIKNDKCTNNQFIEQTSACICEVNISMYRKHLFPTFFAQQTSRNELDGGR